MKTEKMPVRMISSDASSSSRLYYSVERDLDLKEETCCFVFLYYSGKEDLEKFLCVYQGFEMPHLSC